MNSLSGKVSDDRRPVLHNRGIIRRVYRWFVSLMSRKVLRPPSTVERKGVDNASLVANGSVKELGLRVVNHLANYSLPFPPFSSLHESNDIYISGERRIIKPATQFLLPSSSKILQRRISPFFESNPPFFLSRKDR